MVPGLHYHGSQIGQAIRVLAQIVNLYLRKTFSLKKLNNYIYFITITTNIYCKYTPMRIISQCIFRRDPVNDVYGLPQGPSTSNKLQWQHNNGQVPWGLSSKQALSIDNRDVVYRFSTSWCHLDLEPWTSGGLRSPETSYKQTSRGRRLSQSLFSLKLLNWIKLVDDA